MKTYIAFLRGINVGGNNILPVDRLVAILARLGANNVKTYLQSGNAVFQCTAPIAKQLPKKLAEEVKRQHGFEPYIQVMDVEVFRAAIIGNPFPNAEVDPATLHLGFLDAVPLQPNLAKLAAIRKASERFELIDHVFYLHAPEGIGRSKLAAGAEKLLGVPMTMRNWRTVCKVMEMATA